MNDRAQLDQLTDLADEMGEEALIYHCPRCGEECDVDDHGWAICPNTNCNFFGSVS